MAVSFNLPDPYEAQKADIARRQKYAEALQQQAFQPTEQFSYQGIPAPIPATATLAKILAGVGGGLMQAQGAQEARELRETDIKKGQEFAAALGGAKTPEDRQALAMRAMGGEFGQRAQIIGGGEYQMAETRAEKERARVAQAETQALNRESREQTQRLALELRAQGMSDAAANRQALLQIQQQGVNLRAEDLQRRREEDARRAAQLTPPEQRQVFQQQDQIDAGQSTLSLLQSARDLSGKFRGGTGAGAMAYLGSQARSAVGMAPSEESNALLNYDNLVKEQALSTLKATFGAAPTEGERKVLLELQASSGKTPEQRADILDRAIKLTQDRIRGVERNRESILTRSYRQPGAGAVPAAGAPAAPPAPGAAPGQPAAPDINDLLNRYAPR